MSYGTAEALRVCRHHSNDLGMFALDVLLCNTFAQAIGITVRGRDQAYDSLILHFNAQIFQSRCSRNKPSQESWTN